MQDLSTGVLRDLSQFMSAPKPKATPHEKRQALDEACKAVQPDPRKRGPVFELGEILDIRGGKFKITAMTNKRMYLDSIPTL